MPLAKMPKSVKSGLKKYSPKKKHQWMSVYEKAKEEYGDKSKAAATAYSSLHNEELSLSNILEFFEFLKEDKQDKEPEKCYQCANLAKERTNDGKPLCRECFNLI